MGFFDKEKLKKSGGGPRLSCLRCGLYRGVKSPKMQPQGEGRKGILVCGEAPGAEEDKQGKQWQGKAGRTLQRAFRSLGYDLFEDAWVTNAVNCRPPDNRTPDTHEMDCCRHVILDPAVDKLNPKVILLLGNPALESFVGSRWGMDDFGGITRWRGWAIPDYRRNAWLCPTFHPSFVMRKDADEVNTVWKQDLRNAFSLLREPLPLKVDENIVYLRDEDSIADVLWEVRQRREGNWIYFDYETTGLKPHSPGHKIVCVSLATAESTYAFMLPKSEFALTQWKRLLASPQIGKAAHNMAFEDTWSNVILGTQVRNWVWDSMLAAHILDNRSKVSPLKFQAFVHYGVAGYDTEVKPYLEAVQEGANSFNRVEDFVRRGRGDRLLLYCGLDSAYGRALSEDQSDLMGVDLESVALFPGTQEEAMVANEVAAYKLLHQGRLALARAERHGLRVDVDYCRRKSDELQVDIRRLDKELRDSNLGKLWRQRFVDRTNYNSNQQIASVIAHLVPDEKLERTKKGRVSTTEAALKATGHPDVEILLKKRKAEKVRNTYFTQFLREQVDGWIHPFYNLHMVVTYRSSSSNPNFQNIPYRDPETMRVCRRAFFPRKGHQLLSVDYSGLEVSIAACYHKDPTMLAYLNDPESDMHADQADELFFANQKEWGKTPEYKTLRYAAKNGFVFPQFYGDYYVNCAKNLACNWGQLPDSGTWMRGQGLPLPNGTHLAEHLARQRIRSLDDYTDFVERVQEDFWGNRFPVYDRWRKRFWRRYQQRGFIDMLTGFRCSGVIERNKCVNYPVQGAAFHCLLWTAIQLDRIQHQEGWRSRLVGQIHDQVLFDVHPAELDHVGRTIQRVSCEELLKAWSWIIVPLSVDAEIGAVDGPWSEMEDYELAA